MTDYRVQRAPRHMIVGQRKYQVLVDGPALLLPEAIELAKNMRLKELNVDPNVTYAEVIRLAGLVEVSVNSAERAVHAEGLAQAVRDLDTWIKSGGFLPDAWKIAAPVAEVV